MNKDLIEINKKYNDNTYPVFPFISKTKITPLKKGLYRKHNTKFRGITAVFNPETNEYEYPLYGMYYVPEDIVVVPDELELNNSKKAFLQSIITAGFKQTSRPPKFETIKFGPETEEAKLALINKVAYQINDNQPDESIAQELKVQ
jgi:hypothetical protein